MGSIYWCNGIKLLLVATAATRFRRRAMIWNSWSLGGPCLLPWSLRPVFLTIYRKLGTYYIWFVIQFWFECGVNLSSEIFTFLFLRLSWLWWKRIRFLSWLLRCSILSLLTAERNYIGNFSTWFSISTYFLFSLIWTLFFFGQPSSCPNVRILCAELNEKRVLF